MGRPDRGDHRDVGPHQPDQTRYFAGMVHTQLEYPVTGTGGIRDNDRGTPQWLLRLPAGRKVRAGDGKSETQRLFGAGFADTAGHREDLGIATLAGSRREPTSQPMCC